MESVRAWYIHCQLVSVGKSSQEQAGKVALVQVQNCSRQQSHILVAALCEDSYQWPKLLWALSV